VKGLSVMCAVPASIRACGKWRLGDDSTRPSLFVPRVMKTATFSLLLLLSAAASVHAQAQQPQWPTSREAARPGTSQGFLGWLHQFAPSPRRQSRAAPFPPLPRPRPAELTSPPLQPTTEELAPASVQSDQTQTPTDPAATPEGPNEGPLND
jgi:hypothetical protein